MTPPPAHDTTTVSRPCCVYLLYSRKHGQHYLGWTIDLRRRLKEHNEGKNGYTKTWRPWKLLGYEVYDNLTQAKGRERRLKRSPRRYALFKRRMTAPGAITTVFMYGQVVG